MVLHMIGKLLLGDCYYILHGCYGVPGGCLAVAMLSQ